VSRRAVLVTALLVASTTWASRAHAQDASEEDSSAPDAQAAESAPEAGASESTAEPAADARIRYVLERVVVRSDGNTRAGLVRRFVPLEPGEVLDVDDPRIEAIRWRLLGTGWFRDVHLSLERGSRRGRVRLVVELEERNTLVIQQLYGGVSEGILRSGDPSADAVWYAGAQLAETNLLGTGITLGGAFLFSEPQQAVRLRFADPDFLGSGFTFAASGLANNARDFFGSENVSIARAGCTTPDPADCPDDFDARNAVVLYRRFGGSIGTGHDVGAYARYTLDWQGEWIDAYSVPAAASESRNGSTRAIDFSIQRGHSLVSALQLGFVYDRRDDPALPTRGVIVQVRGDLGTQLLGSDYDFFRVQASVLHYVPLPWGHVLRFGAFAGVVFGRAPFFYKFYVSDLSDLIPSRALELNLDRRPPPDLFGTAIRFMRAEDLAARVDVEYAWPLHRGGSGLYALDAYVSAGLYTLFSQRDVQVGVPGFDGLSRVPIDATFDLGLRADTDVGVFQLGFSNVLGFVQP
jgi:outer membrane protein insertion porin family